MSTLGRDINPITNSDLYSRTDHFVSAATGHQVSNRGGGSSGAATYWEVRTAKMEEQAREKVDCAAIAFDEAEESNTEVADFRPVQRFGVLHQRIDWAQGIEFAASTPDYR